MVASVGTFSGPVGAVFLPGLQAVQAWVRYVNDRGGVNGHPVELIVYDDGGDPARHRSQVQEAVERRRVIALLYNAESLAGRPSVEYLESQRIPVVGGEGGESWAYQSPMYFPQASSGDHFLEGAVYGAAEQTVPAGRTRLATVACAEAQFCGDADRIWSAAAPNLGFQQVYRGRTSLTAPDYTAECLAMQRAGAQVALVGLDTNSVGRLALSCGRQGYRPVFSTTGSILTDRMKTDPNLDGMVGASNVFAYFQSGTPATDEFHRVMRSYGRAITPGISAATGWVSAKLFETAATKLGEPPTTASLLKGLWSIKHDTLGGLTQPLTFVEGSPPPGRTCWFNLTIQDHQWVSPNGFRCSCKD